MKFFLTSIYLFFNLSFIAQPIDSSLTKKKISYYYENGIVSSEGIIENGKPNDYWKSYYANGILKNEGNRKDFLLDGIWKFYSEKGILQKTIEYTSGKKNGEIVIYDTTGIVKSTEEFKDDIKAGKTRIFYANGKIHFLISYYKGKPDGDSYEYAEDSTIITITRYRTGIVEKSEKINRYDEDKKKEGKWVEFYETGQIKNESVYRSDVLDGYVKRYEKNGNLLEIEKYSAGKKIKKPSELKELQFYKSFHENGTIKFEGSYWDQIPHGYHYYFSADQKSDTALIYMEGFLQEKGPVDKEKRKIGWWQEFYLSGEIKAEGYYKNGIKSGCWKYYFLSGKTEQQGCFTANGLQTGKWIWYYENGNVLREEDYSDGSRNGFFTDYFEDGKILEQGNYVDNLKEGVWVYEMGNYREKGNYVNDKKDSIWNGWWTTTGKLRQKGSWIQGSAEGKHVWYYENGVKQLEGNFLSGELNGTWNFYDENGFLFLSIIYQDGEEIGFNGIILESVYKKTKEIIDEFKSK